MSASSYLCYSRNECVREHNVCVSEWCIGRITLFTTVVGYSLNQIVQAAFASQILNEGEKVKVENSAIEHVTGALAENVGSHKGSY